MNEEAIIEKRERALKSLKGVEPTINAGSTYKLDLLKVLNYHNSYTDPKFLRKTLLAYLKKNGKGELVPIVDKAHDHEIRQISALLYHKIKGQHLAEKELKLISTTLQTIIKKYLPKKADAPVVLKKRTEISKVDIEVSELISVIDQEIDFFVTNKFNERFDVKEFLKTSRPSKAAAEKLAEIYGSMRVELNEALSGTSEELTEGYSHFSKPQLKRFLAFINRIVEECNTVCVTIKTSKKPRKTKVKSPAVIVTKLKYKKEEESLKIKSVAPTSIVGAKELWVYNVKYKKLIRYVADGSNGLSVKGTTIIGFSEKQSSSKSVKKPERSLAVLTKPALNKELKNLKTKETVPTGRINQEVILLKAF